jgi:hypothetical protein
MEVMMITNKRIITGILTILLACMPATQANIFYDSYSYLKNYLLNKQTLKIAGTITIGIVIGALIAKLKWSQSIPSTPTSDSPANNSPTHPPVVPQQPANKIPTQHTNINGLEMLLENQQVNENKQNGTTHLSKETTVASSTADQNKPFVSTVLTDRKKNNKPIEIKKIDSLVQHSGNADCAFYALHNAQMVFENFANRKNIATATNYLDEQKFKDNLVAWKEETARYRESRALRTELKKLLRQNIVCPHKLNHTVNDKNQPCSCVQYMAAFNDFGNGIADIETASKKNFIVDKEFIRDVLREQLRTKELIENFNTYFPNNFELKVTPEYLQNLVKKSIGNTNNEWLQGDEIDMLKIHFPFAQRDKIFTLDSKNFITKYEPKGKYDPAKDFIHVCILGTMDDKNMNSRGHWYCLAIIKQKNEAGKAYLFDSLKHDLHTEIDPEVLQLLKQQGADASALKIEEIDRTKEPEVVALLKAYDKWFAQAK